MGIVEKWNALARKNIYINESFEIPMGRLMYMRVLNCFLTKGMLLTGGNLIGIVWLWGDVISMIKRSKK